MGLIDSTPSQTNLGGIVAKQIIFLATARGIDPGEYRRQLINDAVEQALGKFIAAHGCYPSEYLQKVGTGGLLDCPHLAEANKIDPSAAKPSSYPMGVPNR